MISKTRLDRLEREALGGSCYFHAEGEPFYRLSRGERLELSEAQWREESSHLPASKVLELVYRLPEDETARPSRAIVYDPAFRGL
jgi:hypothetical protein